MSYQVWMARVNVLVIRQIKVPALDLAFVFDFSAAYACGQGYRAAADAAINALLEEVNRPLPEAPS